MWLRIKRTLRSLPKWQLGVLGIFFGILFLTIFGPYLAPFPTETADPLSRLLPPGGKHWLGTDENGMDIFSRVLAAPRTDVVIGVVATFISVVLGAPLGVLVALYESRGKAGATAFAETFMRLLEVMQSFPVFVFAMVLVAVFGGSITNIIIAIAFVNTPVFIRLVRSEVLSLVQRPFSEAARAVGNTEMRLGFRHIFPNAFPVVMVQVSVTVGFAILLTAGLSFVGAGVRPPTPELGAMIASGAKYLIIEQWWPALFPGVALGLTVFSFGIFGEILNLAMEPRAVRKDVDRRRTAALESGRGGGETAAAALPSALSAAPGGETPVLAVANLRVAVGDAGGQELISDISFSLAPGESMAIVGESGSGKSVLVKAVLQLLPYPLEVTSGTVHYGETNLVGMEKREMRKLRSREIAAILPNAKSQLNPLTTVGAMLVSALQAHEKIATKAALARAIELLEMVGITDPELRLGAYPHELSGGMAQRVCLALALMYRPRLLIADEPTAGLDVTIQRQVLDLTRNLARESGTARLVITGDFGIAAHYCDRVAVMQAGRIVEANQTQALFAEPRHPYTRHLLSCVQV
ncbi:MAG: dipeptide/oligopeptide/nickel ABC transporter permease/ATP-binding protein [Alphaproteobacteria bacterium]|jgi:peptide/nickel transport system permease protein|nr:dipeptide/oligopeptide/nickel ABC transporter permease/ATP-binding protein [Alphaproteobacteria bacterium]MDP6590747.1 dipeptide/oligopeptide/nickel ABC transporter permease/ATP-binding protein [Alphaproteobacteria bacterium]MDP6817412.1 dipeptide/oligopeptide/nickel ABC transporter permease/ATP-binding protein [Alphaproteobacteria bacterium]